MAIKNIIFDYGNVIFSIDFKRVQQALKEIGIADTDEFYGHLKQNSVFDDFEQGLISPAEFRDHVREKAKNPQLTDEAIDNAWNAILVGIADGNHELLMELKPKYRTFLLSNTNAIHYDHFHKYIKDRFGLDNNEPLFEKVYYSHLMRKRKPHVEIFEQVIKENNLNADETLFIDDSPQHLEGAKKAGLHTYLLTAPETIQDFFARGEGQPLLNPPR